MIAVLFDPGERESALTQLVQAGDPVPARWREGLATAFERQLLPHIESFIRKLYESGRGQSASEFESANDFRECVCNVVRTLRLSDGSSLDQAAAKELTDDLDQAWNRFAAIAAAHRMYSDLVDDGRALSRAQARANTQRRDEADAALLRRFADWQAGRLEWQEGKRPKIRLPDGTPLPERKRVQLFKRALRTRDLTERNQRRLAQLLKQGRIPPP
jgi:hypothetical protein